MSFSTRSKSKQPAAREEQKEILRGIQQLLNKMEVMELNFKANFERLEQRLTNMEQRMINVEQRFERSDERSVKRENPVEEPSEEPHNEPQALIEPPM